MAARFAFVTEEEIAQIKLEDSIPKKSKQATKYGLKIFQGKILNFMYVLLFGKNWLRRNGTQSRVRDLNYVNKLFIVLLIKIIDLKRIFIKLC
jgi:hypothetical protein